MHAHERVFHGSAKPWCAPLPAPTPAPTTLLPRPDPLRPGKTRAAPLGGGFGALLAYARVNGWDILNGWVGSGRTLQLARGGASVYFPPASASHAHWPWW